MKVTRARTTVISFDDEGGAAGGGAGGGRGEGTVTLVLTAKLALPAYMKDNVQSIEAVIR